ncbi:hypothetical protein BB561_004929 [Smittium simulii]|uniref:Anaphase-promoting complex subunit 4-like WD40 domain-containing protein n=1 Tax=Smittium simulii TaxID=133385 RepID=A0A2T9YDB2_9FUNG|nr:hypothetical protein BB561_004929 [Smittium simulii]
MLCYAIYLNSHINYWGSVDNIEDNPLQISIEGQYSQVNQLVKFKEDKLVVASMNDQLSVISTDGKDLVNKTNVSAAPKYVGIIKETNMLVAQLTNESVVILEQVEENKEPKVIIKDGSSCVAVHPFKMEIAVGFIDNSVRVYSVANNGSDISIKEKYHVNVNRRDVSSLAYSPNGEYLASGDKAGKIYLLNSEDGSIITNQWVYHTAAVNSMSWFSDSKRMVSGSLDSSIYVWQVNKPSEHSCVLQAHPLGVSGVHTVGENIIVSCGSNSIIKKWEIKEI